MDKHDKVMMIFLTECKEIIDSLEPQLLSLEDNPKDKTLINEVFRGIHTLKGNANSFGFTRLGAFVHYFEDLLDKYRKPDSNLVSNDVDLFLRSFDIVKNVFIAEENKDELLPIGYNEILQEIKDTLNVCDEKPLNKELENLVDDLTISHEAKKSKNELTLIDDKILEKLANNENLKLFNIVMEFDNDLYLRGYNHQIFFRFFKDLGEVVNSFISIDEQLPSIENFDTEHSYVKKISTYLLSESSLEDIEDVFEFIAQDDEISISQITIETLNESKKVLVIDEVVEIKEEKADIEANYSKTTSNEKTTSIRVESQKIDELFDSIGELVIAQSFISQNEEIKSINNKEINQYLEMLGKSTKIIQNKVMSLRMIPIRDTFLKMKRVARDVSKKTDKEIELIINGEETEIDKTMVDKLSEPLIHLLRNSIDHGLERNEDRVALGKESIGKVYLSASHKGSSFVIEIRDDGKGIDAEVILAKAIEKGFASKDVEYSQDEIINFILLPGFSTAKSITDVSGRGVGLDAVKSSIEELRGKFTIETNKGEGTSFKIILPLTLAIIDGLTIRVEHDTYIIPTLAVIESFRANSKDIQKVKGSGEFINFRGDILPILKLNKILNGSVDNISYDESTLICIEHERGRYILQVNELLGRQQVVIKSLGRMMSRVKEVSGAAILGSGNIALILNTEGIRDWLDYGEIN